MRLSKDLREFVALLNSTQVNYLLVGGHAVAFHGYPRFTGDIDFLVDLAGQCGAVGACASSSVLAASGSAARTFCNQAA